MTLDTIMTMTASEADQWFADESTDIDEIERLLEEVEERKKERGYL